MFHDLIASIKEAVREFRRVFKHKRGIRRQREDHMREPLPF